MRIDSFGPRTWLIAGFAAWAALAWILALSGMGGHIRPLPDDPALVTSLPRLPAPRQERLGPLAQYSEIASRPVFSPNRQPQPFFISGDGSEPQAQTFDFILSSVLMTPGFQLAIVQPSQGGDGIRLKVGEAPDASPAWRLSEIHPRSVVFQGPEGPRTLELRVFNGQGGQAPTAVVQAPGNPVPGSNPGGTAVPSPIATSPDRVMAGPPSPATAAAARPPDLPSAMVANAPGNAGAEPAPMTTEQQMDAIRSRIEARRAQLRAQDEKPSPPQTKK